MNVERLYERIPRIVVLAGGLLLAVFCGVLAGGGQFNRLGLIFLVMAIMALCLVLRAQIWLLIPLFWPLSGAIPLLEVPFAVRDIAVGVTFVAFLVLMGFKVVRTKSKFDMVDLLIFVNLFYLCTVFLRNPVGVKAFNSEMVGGKPYFNVFIACIAYFILSRVPIQFKTVCLLPLFLLPAPAFVALGTLMSTYTPALAGKIGLDVIYSEFSDTQRQFRVEDPLGRKQGLMNVGMTGIQVLTAYFRPLTLLFPVHFWRFATAIMFIIAILLSGFRSALAMVGVYIILSTLFRRQLRDLLAFATVGVIGLTVLSLGNGRLFELPLAAQRALSFLPGKWDNEATYDAQRSIDWRVDMWNMVWQEDRWIRNKWLGDGFGFTRRELSMMESVATGGAGFLGGAEQEAFMINGVFHHGPLSTIRYVGGIGLALYYALMVLLAIRAVRAIRMAQGTGLFPAALFVGMPIIFYVLTYPFGAGHFDTDAPQHIFMAGLIKLVGRAADTLPKPAEQGDDKLFAPHHQPSTKHPVPSVAHLRGLRDS